MEPASMITGAIMAGAATAAKGVGSQMVKDAYDTLKNTIQDWFKKKKNPEGEMALKKIESKPETWEAPLKDALTETGGDNVPEIAKATDSLKKAMEESPECQQALGKYNLNIKDSKIGIVGDGAQVGTLNL